MRTLTILLLSLVSAAVLAAACGSSGDGGVEDMAPIFESGPDVVEITARSARVLAVTKIDMVCSAAYGPTKEYGQIATDLDMAGGGHSNHRPLLTGLEPDTEYHLRLAGIGPDGTIYKNKDLTFRTSAEEPGVALNPSGDNLAVLSGGARVVGTSSNFGGADNAATWGGNQAIDGDPGTQWSSNGDGNDAWIEIELAAETRVTGIGFWTRTMGDSAQIERFRVVADNGDTTGPLDLDDAGSIQYFEADLIARRLRFEVLESSGGNTGAVEIAVYGEPAP